MEIPKLPSLDREFGKWDTIGGWTAFGIAFLTYALTVEPTGSFWDAGEYITTSAKLQVGHPPGAPLLQMIGAFFATFAFGAAQNVALMVNSVSVVSSAFAVLFTFWIITNLVQKLIKKDGRSGELERNETLMVLGSGLVGALAFTWSDSFWFNAVETEVYAMASFIMALLLWLGLRWTDALDEPRGHRWLLLICFVIGLVFGIQFMGFLAIPPIGLLFFFKKYKTFDWKQFLIANVVVVALLFLVFKFSLTYVLKIFGWGEVFFVNQLGLPFNSGTLFVGLAFVAAFTYGLRFTRQKGYATANLLILCTMFLFLGFSSWLMLPIRANAQTVVNENNPEDARSLLAYYNREQYPSPESPFFGSYFSQRFADPPEDKQKDDKPKYEKDRKLGKYVIVNDYKDALPASNPKHVGLLPRMWSEQHAENYMRHYGLLDYRIRKEYLGDQDLRSALDQLDRMVDEDRIDAEQYVEFLREFEQYIEVEPPSLGKNLQYLFEYQWGYMYLRYLMWNFVGRQNDLQGRYDGNGNWISGIGFIDSLRLGSQKDLPKDLKDNKARNTYFFLPLLLGILGIVFQVSRDPKQFWVLFVYFVFTGLAIQFYTNPHIFQPRERDYSLVGSFFVFCLWIGFGAYGLYDELSKWVKRRWLAPATIGLCLVAVPFLMAFQNWDDHDRSGRKTARAAAYAYLDSCEEDVGAILFTIGDNDTFPLWYAQEIEGHRTDVRIVNTSLFQTDWYIDQMKRRAYDSPPIPSQLTHEQYRWGTRDAIYYQPLPQIAENRWSIQDFMDWVASDKPTTKLRHVLEQRGVDISDTPQSTLDIVYYPTNKIRVPVNKAKVLASGIVKEKDKDLIVDYIDIDLPRSALAKNRILMLDILANNDWERPIYFSGGSFDKAEYLWMKEYLQLDGLVYKLVPIRTEPANGFELGRIDGDLMYDIVMEWDWGNSQNPNIYHDPQTRSQGLSYRSNLARLVEQLLREEKPEKARDIIDLSIEKMPVERYGFYTFVEPFMDGYFKVGEKAKGLNLFERLKAVYTDRLDYYSGLGVVERERRVQDMYGDLEGYSRNIMILYRNGEKDRALAERDVLNSYYGEITGQPGVDYMEGAFDEEQEDLPLSLSGIDSLLLEQLKDSLSRYDTTARPSAGADSLAED